jgi:hypothetical protein
MSHQLTAGQACACDAVLYSKPVDPAQVTTSYVERQNLTIRTEARRFARLTKGFSKEVDNHVAMSRALLDVLQFRDTSQNASDNALRGSRNGIP